MQRMGDIAVATPMSPGGDTSRELDALAKVLPEGERVRDMAAGVVGSDNALLVVTDRRVLLVLEDDDHQGSTGLPLSELRTARWEPAAECHQDRTDYWGDESGAESGARWGSVWLGDAHEGVRLSLVVARDGERIVALIRSDITPCSTSAHISGAGRARSGPLHRRAAMVSSRPGQRPEPAEILTASTAREPDTAEMPTAVIARELDTVEVLTPGISREPGPLAAAGQGSRRAADAGPGPGGSGAVAGEAAVPAAGAMVASAGTSPRVTPDRGTGRHRGAEKSQPTRHDRGRSSKVKRFWLVAAVAVGLGAVAAVGVRVANPPPAAFVGCTTHAGDPGAVARALTSASPGDRICITADLPSVRVAITRGGDAAQPITVVGDGQTVVGGITVHADNVVVSGFQVLGDPAHAIQIRGSGINVENNMGAAGRLAPAWE
jgi:hypothetical protein